MSRSTAPRNRFVRFLRTGAVLGRALAGYKAITLAERIRGTECIADMYAGPFHTFDTNAHLHAHAAIR